jgi:hypothetical protein
MNKLRQIKIFKMFFIVFIGLFIWCCTMPEATSVEPNRTPQNIKVISRDSSSITLGWDQVSNAVTYNIYRDESKEGKFDVLLGYTSGIFYKDASSDTNSLSSNKRYYYVIGAIVGGLEYKSAVFTTNTLLATPVIYNKEINVYVNNYNYVSNESKVSIKWSVSENATKYEVYKAVYSGTSEISYSKLASVSQTDAYCGDCYYQDTNLKVGKSYYYKVKAIDSCNNMESDFSNVFIYSPKVGDVTGFKVVEENINSITLMWDVNTSGVTGYYIYYSLDNENYEKLARISSFLNITYIHTGLKIGTKYYYKILSYINTDISLDEIYDKKNALSTPVIGITRASLPVVSSTDSDVLKINDSESSMSAVISYTKPSSNYGDGLKIYRCQSIKNNITSYPYNADSTNVVTLSWDSTSYTDTGLQRNTSYYYAIASYIDYNDAAASSTQSCNLNFIRDSSGNIKYFKGRTPPPVSTTFYCSDSNRNNLTLNWNKPSDEDNCAYTYLISDNDVLCNNSEVPKGIYALNLTQLPPGTHTFKIVNRVYYTYDDNESSNSDSIPKELTLNIGLPAPENFRIASVVNFNTINLSWDHVYVKGSTVTYNIYRSTSESERGDKIAAGVTANTYTDNTPIFNATNYYHIYPVYNVAESSLYSTCSQLITLPAPASFSVTQSNFNYIKLSWAAVSYNGNGTITYVVSRTNNTTGSKTVLFEISSTSGSDYLPALDTGFTYSIYAKHTYNGSNFSTSTETYYSSVFSASLGIPCFLNMDNEYVSSSGSLTLNWNSAGSGVTYCIRKYDANKELIETFYIDGLSAAVYIESNSNGSYVSDETYYYTIMAFLDNGGPYSFETQESAYKCVIFQSESYSE